MLVKKISLITLLLLVFAFWIFTNFSISKTPEPKTAPDTLKGFLKQLKLGNGYTFKNITLYPIKYETSLAESFIFLDDAIKQGIIEIKEIGNGNVNKLTLIKNKSNVNVFLMAGEIIKGAKQDRIIAHDMLLSADPKVYEIDVYCVEQGRWTKQSEKFEASDAIGAQAIRSAVAQNKSQSDIWINIEKKNRALGATSSTSNYRASYESKAYKDSSSDYIDHFINFSKQEPSSTGVIVVINNKVSNLDLFGNPLTFKTMWPKLLKSYVQDAIAPESHHNVAEYKSASEFLNSLTNHNYSEIPNPGLGNEFNIKGSKTSGNCLIFNKKLIHMALFTDNSDTPEKNNNEYENIPNIIRRR